MKPNHSISAASGGGILIFDEKMSVRFANARAGEIFGSSPDALLRSPLATVDGMFGDLQSGMSPAGPRPLRQSVSAGTPLVDRILGLKRPDNSIITVSLNVSPLHDENHSINGLVVEVLERRRSENERLHRFIGAMDEIVFEFDAEGRYLHIWSENEDLLKRPRKELLGRRFDEVVPRELAEKLHGIFRRVRNVGQPETLEYPLEVLGGTRWFLARIAPVPSTGGAEPTFSYLARDITAQKRLEQSLRESESRFRRLFQNAAIGVALVGLDGRSLEANQYLQNLLGYSLEDLRQNPYYTFCPQQDAPLNQEEFRQLVRGEREAIQSEKRFLHKEGREIWGHLTVTLQRDEEGRPCCGIAILEDITRRKKVEAEKDRLLREMDAIFSAAADGIILYDEKGYILRMNRAAQAITGYTEKEKRMSFSDRYRNWAPRRPDGGPAPLAEMEIGPVFQGKTVKRTGVPFNRPDGRQVWVSFSSSPIVDRAGRRIGIVTTITDITEVWELQERLENHLHMLAHDLHTPLTVITGHTQILQGVLSGTPLEEPTAVNTEAVLNAAEQMGQMMEDLVEVGQLESGQVPLHQEVLFLPNFMAGFLLRQIAKDYDRIRVSIPPDLPPVRVGAHHLARCLDNLLSNALKYSSPDMTVDVGATVDEGRVCLFVQDHGEGITPQELPHIFKRFFRTSKAKGNASGTGMGLYITKSIIEAYGGDIKVESELGRGARFILFLPVASPDKVMVGNENPAGGVASGG